MEGIPQLAHGASSGSLSLPELSHHKLTPVQVEELTKAFAACDKDGNGVITINELGQVVSHLANIPIPADNEVQALMRIMDKDGNGTVELPEFLSTMSDWLQEEDSSSKASSSAIQPSKRRGDDGDDDSDRFKLHRQVTKFFLQFRASGDFQKVRSTLRSWRTGELMDFVPIQDVETVAMIEVPGLSIDTIAEANKQRANEKCRDAPWDDLIQAVNVNNGGIAESALRDITNLLLDLLVAYPTPADRREIGDMLIAVFEKLFHFIPRLAQFVESIYPAVQWYALKILTLIAPGPRIASTPVDFWMNSSFGAFKEEIYKANIVPTAVRLMQSAYGQVREQALMFIGCMARDHPVYRDFILNQGALNAIQAMFNGILLQPNFITTLRDATWVVAILCGDGLDPVTHWHLVKNILPILAELLTHIGTTVKDFDVLSNICRALSYLLPGMKDDEQGFVCKALVDLLSLDDIRAKKTILLTIGHVMVDDDLTLAMLMHGLLIRIKTLLQDPEHSIRYAACKIISILAGAKGRIQMIIDCNLVEDLIHLTIHDKYTRKVTVRILRYMMRGTMQQIIYIVTHFQVVPVLCHTFSYFQSKDDVIANVYNYSGPCFDFEMLQDAIAALNSVVDAGQIDANESHHANILIQPFTVECVAEIGLLLKMMKEAPAEMINSFKQHQENAISSEERIRHLLHTIKRGIRSFPELLDSANLIDDILRTFFSEGTSSKLILVKCTYDQDVKVVEITKTILFEDFKSLVEARFGFPVYMTCKTIDGEHSPVDRQSVLERLIDRKLQDEAHFININIFKEVGNSGHSGSTNSTPNMDSATKSPFALGVTNQNVILGMHDLNGAVSRNKQTLFSDLLAVSSFGPAQLQDLLTKWSRLVDTPDGELNFEQFRQGLIEMGLTDPLVIEENFKAFDVNHDGKISFNEFLVGLSTLSKGDEDERLELMFRAYDLDGDGSISRDEMLLILKSTKEARGEEISHFGLVQEVNELFLSIDVDGDQRITLDEFKSGVKGGHLIAF